MSSAAPAACAWKTVAKALLYFVDHQFAAGRLAFLRDLMESHDDRLPPRARFFHKSVGDALRDLPLLIGGAALQHSDLNYRHAKLLMSSAVTSLTRIPQRKSSAQ